MEQNTLAELVATEKTAKEEWERAVQEVKKSNEVGRAKANDRVGHAHSKWLSAKSAVDAASTKPKSNTATSG